MIVEVKKLTAATFRGNLVLLSPCVTTQSQLWLPDQIALLKLGNSELGKQK